MKYILLALFFSICGCKKDSKEKLVNPVKPNIILILVDDLGKEWVSCYGADSILTPNVDKLAKTGVLFTNFYVMPQCTPTRLTLLTGQYPYQHGWVNHWDVPRWGGGAHYDESLNPSLGIEMKKAGYKTCIAGKWQIDDFRVEPDALIKSGFDEFCMWTGGEGGNPPSNERYQNPYIFTKEGSNTYSGAFGPDIFKDFIVDFIGENKAKPFFIYYPMVLTHTPLVNTPDEVAETKPGKHKAMVRYTDKITGEIVAAIEEAGVRDNTVILWTTDNGTARGITGSLKGTPVMGGKAQTTENGINVPLIVSWPDQLNPGMSNALVDIADMYPTFLDLAGANIDSLGQVNKIQGKSFKKVLTENSEKSEREWILSMGGQNNARLTENGVENKWIFRDRVIRNERYKLCIGTSGLPEKFYDLANDPFEQINLMDSLNNLQRRSNFEKLKAIVDSHPRKDNDPIYRKNPPQQWDVKISAESQVWKSN